MQHLEAQRAKALYHCKVNPGSILTQGNFLMLPLFLSQSFPVTLSLSQPYKGIKDQQVSEKRQMQHHTKHFHWYHQGSARDAKIPHSFGASTVLYYLIDYLHHNYLGTCKMPKCSPNNDSKETQLHEHGESTRPQSNHRIHCNQMSHS